MASYDEPTPLRPGVCRHFPHAADPALTASSPRAINPVAAATTSHPAPRPGPGPPDTRTTVDPAAPPTQKWRQTTGPRPSDPSSAATSAPDRRRRHDPPAPAGGGHHQPPAPRPAATPPDTRRQTRRPRPRRSGGDDSPRPSDPPSAATSRAHDLAAATAPPSTRAAATTSHPAPRPAAGPGRTPDTGRQSTRRPRPRRSGGERQANAPPTRRLPPLPARCRPGNIGDHHDPPGARRPGR